MISTHWLSIQFRTARWDWIARRINNNRLNHDILYFMQYSTSVSAIYLSHFKYCPTQRCDYLFLVNLFLLLLAPALRNQLHIFVTLSLSNYYTLIQSHLLRFFLISMHLYCLTPLMLSFCMRSHTNSAYLICHIHLSSFIHIFQYSHPRFSKLTCTLGLLLHSWLT